MKKMPKIGRSLDMSRIYILLQGLLSSKKQTDRQKVTHIKSTCIVPEISDVKCHYFFFLFRYSYFEHKRSPKPAITKVGISNFVTWLPNKSEEQKKSIRSSARKKNWKRDWKRKESRATLACLYRTSGRFLHATTHIC